MANLMIFILLNSQDKNKFWGDVKYILKGTSINSFLKEIPFIHV